MSNIVANGQVSKPLANVVSNAKTAAIDSFEKIVLLIFYCSFLGPVFTAVYFRTDIAALLVLVSETMVVVLTLCRRPAQTVSTRLRDWVLAFSAAGIPMLVRPVEGPTYLWHTLAAMVMMLGIAFQIYAKYTLGRRFGAVAANRGICSRGPYRIVRHPIYMGYMATHIGFLCMESSLWNLGVYALFYALLVPRILAEETLLTQDVEYAAYRREIRYRLIPGVF